MLDVPPLRKLRHLPVATTLAGRGAAAWSARQGIIAACLVLAAVPALWACWSRFSEPRIAPFDADIRRQVVDQGLKGMTPVEAWNLWVDRYRPMAEHGFAELQHPHAAAIEQYVAKQRFLQKTLLAVAGGLAAVALVAAVWKRPKARPPRR
jgi:hypothetical protein